MTTAAQNSKQFLVQKASAATPSYSFLGNNTTGWYLSATNEMSAATNGTQKFVIDSSGNVGVNTSSPGAKLDVKGTLRLSGATSGYVGLAPAATAGSTTYTLPTADGSNGQSLTTNGSGVLSWSSTAASAATSTALGTVYGSMTTSGGTPFLTALGYNAGTNATGVNNTMVGKDAGKLVSTGTDNTIIGWTAGDAITTGTANTAVGSDALGATSTASQNTGVGYQSFKTATGTGVTGLGWNSGWQVTSGNYNTAVGWQTVASTTTGGFNTGVGGNALSSGNATGRTGVGWESLKVGTGDYNTAVGYASGQTVSTGTYNTLIGTNAGNAITTGGKNVILGSYTGNSGGLNITTSSNYIVLSDGDANIRQVIDSSGNVGVGKTPATLLDVAGPIALNAPTTKTANYSMAATDSSLIFNGAGSITLTLQAASSYTGRMLYVKTIAAQTVVSASSNVVPVGSATAGTAILAATAGKWAILQSDGTNWVIMAAN